MDKIYKIDIQLFKSWHNYWKFMRSKQNLVAILHLKLNIVPIHSKVKYLMAIKTKKYEFNNHIHYFPQSASYCNSRVRSTDVSSMTSTRLHKLCNTLRVKHFWSKTHQDIFEAECKRLDLASFKCQMWKHLSALQMMYQQEDYCLQINFES